MTAQLIDGKAFAQQIRDEVTATLVQRTERGLAQPSLATFAVGDRSDLVAIIASREKQCQDAGLRVVSHRLPANASQQQVENLIRQNNSDPQIHGILIQTPLPSYLDQEAILALINPEKDVNGSSSLSFDRLARKGHTPIFSPCTAEACIYLLEKTGIEIEGAHAVVIGRSNIIGMPVALLLLKRNATVTICHSHTHNLSGVVQQADLIIAAVGQSEMVRGSWIKPGAAVIDVGINEVPDLTKKSGKRMVGDVCFKEAVEVAGCITPVPGGVGPMTNAILIRNILRAAEIQDR